MSHHVESDYRSSGTKQLLWQAWATVLHWRSEPAVKHLDAMAKGRPPKEFHPDFGQDTGAGFDLWLEDVNDYMKICQVSTPEDTKCLLLNVVLLYTLFIVEIKTGKMPNNIGPTVNNMLKDIVEKSRYKRKRERKNDGRLVATNLAGLGIRKIVMGLVVPAPSDATHDDPGDTYKALTEAVRAHFCPSRNTTSERHKFRQIKQTPDESVSTFVSRLREKVEWCDFAATDVDSVVNTQVRDQLIAGLRLQELRRELLKETKLTLADAVSKAVTLEASFSDCKLYESRTSPGGLETSAPRGPELAAVVLGSVSGGIGSGDRRAMGKTSTKSLGCKYCGRVHAKGKQFCSAALVRCRDCGKVGHFAAVCLSSKAHAVQDEDSEAARIVYDSIYACSDKAASGQFTMTLMVNVRPCEGLLDTGATRTILTDDVVQPTRCSDSKLRTYNGGEVKTLGMADVDVAVGERSIQCECFVVPADRRTVQFGQDVIAQLELLVNTHLADTAWLVDTAPASITVDQKARPVAQPARRPPFSR